MAAQSLSVGQWLGVRMVRGITVMVLGTMSFVKNRRNPVGKNEFSYGPHQDHRLDHLLPDASRARQEAVVFMHGGGWIAGSKDYYPVDLQFLTQAGYPVFNLEYPLAPV